MLTDAGTVAALLLLELKFMVRPPAGAGADKVSVRFPVPGAVTVEFNGEKLTDATTCTVRTALPYPAAEAVTVTGPKPKPVICGCATGTVAPEGMTTLVVESLALVASLSASVTVTAPGAFPDNVTGNATDCPRPTLRFVGSPIVPSRTTDTFALIPGIPGETGIAAIFAEPAAIPVIGTLTAVSFAMIVTLSGTVATLELLDRRFTLTPVAGAGEESRRDMFCTAPTPTVVVDGEKLKLAATLTVSLSPRNPGAEALMSADPRFTPFTCGAAAGVVAPCGMTTLDGVIVTLLVSLLESEIVTPPVGAAVARLT
jgi:hypothetical protein